EFLYKTTNYYHPESDRGIIWNDPNIDIVWPERENIVLSKKDINQPNLSYSFSLKQLLS
ncbi:TPA: dTDP-4-dehydrorhamnose 3,5-epimerase family protein, partial [Escherichia coli]|nr:dTDP-4-dehydrorhamnose 3,5-epimerase family protein [Escherichia coli]